MFFITVECGYKGRLCVYAVQVEVLDIEHLAVLGKQSKACPYYGTRYAIPSAEVCGFICGAVLTMSTVQ